MKRLFVRVVPAVVLVFLVAPLIAQQRQPGGRGFGGGQGGIGALLNNKSVQDELKVSDEQKEKLTSSLKDLRDKYKDSFKDREKAQEAMKEMSTETNKIVEKLLKPEQVKRLHQVELQVAVQQGTVAVLNQERVQKALNYTDKQKTMIKETAETLAKERREMIGGGTGRPDPEKMQAFQKKAKESVEKIMETLSTDQKKTWTELTGAKFEYKADIRRPRPQQ